MEVRLLLVPDIYGGGMVAVLVDGVDWEKLLAFIDTNMSETVMKNSEKQYQSLKTLMRRKLTIYVLRKSGVWLMQACWNTLAHGETATAITS
ncbi:Transcription factor HY5-like [Trichinella spiralis]|uniref:Transcription factor HY5-like n=1 Tax=Trichinella spiralis TaxID=6334 RepID=A0ABR3L0N0_TRISP